MQNLRRTRAFVSLLLLGVAAAARAQDAPASALPSAPIAGHVVDREGFPLAGATVAIVELNRAAVTGKDGAFRLGIVANGHYTLSARRVGYRPAIATVVVAGQAVISELTLDVDALRIEPVNVTATRGLSTALSTPLPVSTLTSDQVDRDGGVSLAASVAQLPGVRDVSTGKQIGKPMIRGLFGPRVLVLADGSRLEDYSWSDEDGPSIDARLANRVEVIRGPASVLYGSDALSGVVNVIPTDLPYSADGTTQRRGALEAYGASNNAELGSAGMFEGAESNTAWRVMGTGRFSQNYNTPTGTMPNSSFWAFNGEGAFGLRGDNGTTTIRAAHYGGEFHLLESAGPETADPNGGPVRQTSDDRVQISHNYFISPTARLEAKEQYQRHSLTEVSDDCVPPLGQTSCQAVKDQRAFSMVLNTATVDLTIHHTTGDHLLGAIGASGMYQASNSFGPIFIIPNATVNTVAAFAFEQLALGRLTLVGGTRADVRNLTTDGQPELNLPPDNRSWSARSADGGVVFRASSNLSLVANYGTGWRAPTLFDLYANGPNLAENRFEVGDARLLTERSKNLDGGVRWVSDRFQADVSVYRNSIDNFIFATPINQNQAGLQVFLHEQADARLTGAEASLAARVSDRLTLRGAYDFVDGTERDTDTPLPLMPPPRTILGAEYALGHVGSWHDVSAGTEVEIDQRQTRLNSVDFPTDGYSLLNFDLAAERTMRAHPLRLDLDVRNALNTTYRDYLSRFKQFASAPGVSLILKASVGTW